MSSTKLFNVTGRMLACLALLLALAVVAKPVRAAQPETAHPAAPTESAAEGQAHRPGGEVNIQLPDLSQGEFLGVNGHQILMSGLLVCVLGLLFGAWTYAGVKRLPVHRSMAEISDLIYETCKAYMVQQGKLLLVLELFIGTIIVAYFWMIGFEAYKIAIILIFSLIGMGGSYGVAWFGIRINTLANSRTAFASLSGKAWPVCDIPLRAGMSVGMMLISVELLFMLGILLFIPGEYAGPCFLGFAIGESLGAAALRIAGGIFTKIADIGSDLMKVVFKIKEDDARNPGVIADCTGDNAGDSVGPTADGFETYGVTGVALISFIVLAVPEPLIQVKLLVWMFMIRAVMVVASGVSYLGTNAVSRGALRLGGAHALRGAAHAARLGHLDRLGRAHLHPVAAAHPGSRREHLALVAAVDRGHVRHPGGRDHPRAGQGLHVDEVGPRQGGGHLVARRRRVAEHPVRVRGRKLQRLLAGADHHGPDGHRVRRQHPGAVEHLRRRRPADHAGSGDLRVRPRGVRVPRHGAGDDCRRLLRPCDRQRPVCVRAVHD